MVVVEEGVDVNVVVAGKPAGNSSDPDKAGSSSFTLPLPAFKLPALFLLDITIKMYLQNLKTLTCAKKMEMYIQE